MSDTQLTEQDITRTVDNIIRDQLNLRGDEKLLPAADLEKDYDADSLDFVCIVMNLETEFERVIKDEECGNIHTVQEIYDFVKAKLQLKKGLTS